MNQTIKFRVWDTLQNRMYYPDGQIKVGNDNFNYPTLFQSFEVPDEKSWSNHGFVNKIENRLIVQQYIGRKDFRNTEIYEGDIVEYIEKMYDHGDSSLLKGIVKYEDKYMCCFGIAKDLESDCRNFFWEGVVDGFKVIGNIFENPELLKI